MRVTPKSRQEWRAWLERYHSSVEEVWLVFFKRHTGIATLSYNDAVEEALCFGWIDGMKRSVDSDRYMHRFSPRRARSKWSESNRKRAEGMMDAGLMTAAGQRAIADAKKSGLWSAARPTFDFSMPPELEAGLKRNKKAAAFFRSLAPSYRRQYIGWITTAKRQDTRTRRAAEAIELLARGEKLGMR